MRAKVQWCGDLKFLGTSGSGHSVVMDGQQGQHAPSPMEMVLMSVASCSSVDVVSILQKARQRIQHCEVDVTAERADAVPAVFTSIHLHFIVTGEDIAEQHVERAVKLSADKYCSVSIMLGATVKVTHSFSVKPSDM
ncbi:OsmC family protein [Aliidiomarina maris]|uniref:OsmC family protein n=1 Tax=Aliidiomarina maris TaxID=531312 RepID=A0A327X0Z5_9GAMM|nr:OsmC family protein [Aliidiomarina maris]MBA3988930.1 OsmC family protein [Idiomarina sp.]MCL5050337.1 OsmC family protein [Bacillota bacterium]RAJ98275.1 putative redox protein [Aliidiomarina maris]RUO24891.1 OsmC family protein [Aliidiomarina maris]